MKCIPAVWTKRNVIDDNDSEEEKARKELMNRCLIERRPYFFRHRYPESKKEYDSYRESREAICRVRYGIGVDELRVKKNKTDEEKAWLEGYDEYCPLTESDSPMNLICRYLEKMEAEIRDKCKAIGSFDPSVYIDESQEGWEAYYGEVVSCYKRHLRDHVLACVGDKKLFVPERSYEKLRESLSFVCSNPAIAVNCLVKYLMMDGKRRGVDVFWKVYGRQLAKHARRNALQAVSFPFPSEDGEIEYLGKKYKVKEVGMNEEGQA